MNPTSVLKLLALFFCLCVSAASPKPKVIILGIDGLDPNLLDAFMEEGVLPNFSKFVSAGDYKPLQTTMAPQSPVAWSTFITGLDPGGHGIYDFVHRDPHTMLPFLSMSRAVPAENSLALGSWVFPLSSGKVELLRKGRAFWELLGEQGVSTTIFRMPVNFPPVEVPGNHSLSGMGTPDILGTPGTFSFFTTKLPPNFRSFSGGKAFKVKVKDDRVQAQLIGPKNPHRREIKKSRKRGKTEKKYVHPSLKRDFTVFLDRQAKAAKFNVGAEEFILKQGEWSDWVPVDFEAVPWVVSVSSLARFYLKEVEPEFQLYVSPLQINPENPAMPISHPKGWSKHLCACVDFFYTQELPEDTKALTCGVFSGHEFWDQAMIVFEERCKAFHHLLETNDKDFLFFYFMTVDQGCHMLWRYMDENHPFHEADEFLKDGIQKIYQKMDDVLGTAMDAIDENTHLIVMSDHGFAPFYWGVNLNTWLAENEFVHRKRTLYRGKSGYFKGVDWAKTKAYAVGLNGLYVNLEGREKFGSVPESEYDVVLDQLETDLLAMVDPKTGRHPITKITRVRRDFHGPHKTQGPDIIVGYSWGYRSSWESPMGEFPEEVFVENKEEWSGDHCIDNRIVPGVLITNQKISLETPALYDLTVAVLDEFGVAPLPEMIGKDCLSPAQKAVASKQETENHQAASH